MLGLCLLMFTGWFSFLNLFYLSKCLIWDLFFGDWPSAFTFLLTTPRCLVQFLPIQVVFFGGFLVGPPVILVFPSSNSLPLEVILCPALEHQDDPRCSSLGCNSTLVLRGAFNIDLGVGPWDTFNADGSQIHLSLSLVAAQSPDGLLLDIPNVSQFPCPLKDDGENRIFVPTVKSSSSSPLRDTGAVP